MTSIRAKLALAASKKASAVTSAIKASVLKASPGIEHSDAVLDAMLASRRTAESVATPMVAGTALIAANGSQVSLSQSASQTQPFFSFPDAPKVQLDPAQFKAVRAAVHGVFQAVTLGALNPLDLFLTKSTANLKPQVSNGCTYSVAFKQLFPQGPYQDAGKNMKLNLTRNIFMFPVKPWVEQYLQSKGFSKTSSQIGGGMGMGIADAILSGKKEALKTLSWAKSMKSQDEAAKSISSEKLLKMEVQAIKWRLSRSVIFWGIMPVTANYIQSLIQNPDGSQYAHLEHLRQQGDYVRYYLNKGGDAAVAGGLAGIFSSFFSYPCEVAKNRAIIGQPVWGPFFTTLEEKGIYRTMLEHTHKNFLWAGLRMGLAGVAFQLTLGGAELATRPFFAQKPSKSLPTQEKDKDITQNSRPKMG